MKRKILLMGAAVAIVGAAALLFKKAGSPNQYPPVVFESETDRAKLRRSWMASVKSIVLKTGDTEAIDVLSFFEANSLECEAHPQGMRFLEKGKTENWFGVVFLTEKDLALGPMWANLGSLQTAAGHFLPDIRGLVIKSHLPLSANWRAIIFLHEGFHAKEYITRKYDWQDEKTFCYEEVKAHEFQNRIIAKLGGNTYEDFLRELIGKIEKRVKEQDGTVFTHDVNDARWYDGLDRVFGRPVNVFEQAFRASSVHTHAYFAIYDRELSTDGAADRKARFLRDIYRRKGVLK